MRGTLLHGDAETWTRAHFASKVRAGKVKTEFRVVRLDGSHGEIDLVRVKQGDQHFIYDFKPVNLADLARDPAFGQAFTEWLDCAFGGDYAEFCFRNRDQAMPRALRDFTNDRISGQIRQHRTQLEEYREAYILQLGDPQARVHDPIVIPYWVWR